MSPRLHKGNQNEMTETSIHAKYKKNSCWECGCTVKDPWITRKSSLRIWEALDDLRWVEEEDNRAKSWEHLWDFYTHVRDHLDDAPRCLYCYPCTLKIGAEYVPQMSLSHLGKQKFDIPDE